MAVVELGSFVAASRRLGLARPTLRRRLDELEAEVGVPLLVRTRAGSVPTEAGELLARRGQDLLRDEAAVLAAVREVGEEPRGELELVMPVGTAPALVAALMAGMREHYPKLVVRLRTADDPLAALQEGVDVAVAFGTRQPGGRWVSVEVGRVKRQLVASPVYLERAGAPKTLGELVEHELLAWTPPEGHVDRWPLVAGGVVEVELMLASPDIHLVRQVAAHGLGIAFAPEGGLPQPGPPLVPVMAHVVGDEVPIRIVVPAAMEGRPRIRALLDEIRALAPLLDPEFVRR